MESDLQQHHSIHPQPMMNPGLTRFRSAPSSFFASSFDICEDFLNRPSSPETEHMLTRLLSGGNIGDSFEANITPNEENNNTTAAATTTVTTNQQPQFMGYIKSEAEVLHNNSATPSQTFYQNSAQPPLPDRKVSYGVGSNLIRQSSSPAGFFSNINIDTGYAIAMRGVTKFGAANVVDSKGGEALLLPPLDRGFGSNANFSSSSRVASSMAQMSIIAEIGDRSDGSFAHEQDDDFVNDFPIESWEDAMRSVVEDHSSSSSLKRARDEDSKPFSASDVQNEEGGQGQGRRSRVPLMLAHHLSLPKMLPDMSEIDKFLQDSVPCKIRAKRGCATHPRSIAERVRRTKISERMRKLQVLVPNMDKQTNTSDMLDLAVDHIKDLQNQVKMLTANRARCTCLCPHHLYIYKSCS